VNRSTLRGVAYAAALLVGALSLVGVTAFATLAVRDARGASHEVRVSTDLWNAYQQARYSVLQEALLTQDFRLAASPDFEERFAEQAAKLETALRVVEHAYPADKALAEETRRTNAELARGISRLVGAVTAGNARRAERVATEQLDPLFRHAIETVDSGADAHRAESRVGLEAAETAEASLRRSAVAVVLLALLALTTGAVAFRFRRRLDQTRRLELQRLRNAALTDSLTGVYNHRAFHEKLETLIEAPDEQITLLMLDLDGLKEVNDRYGHEAGDNRIRLLSSAAASAIREPDRLYRLGGDEFALVLRRGVGAAALALADRIDDVFRRDALDTDVSFSGGVAISEPGITKSELVRRADLALIEAKRLHQRALVYSPAFEVAVIDEPADLRHTQILARALARAVDTKDAYTHSHCETVAELCALIADELGLDREQVFKIRLAGLLHDVGKIGVPDSILQKPGRLTHEEFALMKSHPALGAHILAAAELHDEAAWVLAHHERPDGKGYPNGGTTTPLEARIISVADAFEAMISDRPYRKARSASDALAELRRCADRQFDRRCVQALGAVLRTAMDDDPKGTEAPPRPSPIPVGAAA
jgi:diguanylate cyclase (GGDEF)-like protein/putative nucleotidyltransferase with HDIG domain